MQLGYKTSLQEEVKFNIYTYVFYSFYSLNRKFREDRTSSLFTGVIAVSALLNIHYAIIMIFTNKLFHLDFDSITLQKISLYNWDINIDNLLLLVYILQKVYKNCKSIFK
jgi:hypothetical protein